MSNDLSLTERAAVGTAKALGNVALKTGTYAAKKMANSALKKGTSAMNDAINNMDPNMKQIATNAVNVATNNKGLPTNIDDLKKSATDLKKVAINAHNTATNFVNENAEAGNVSKGIFETLIALYFEILKIIVKYGITKVAETMGLEPENLNYNYAVNDFMSDVSQYKNTLTSEEGKKMLAELSDILIIAIKELEPAIQELIDTMNRLIEKQVTTGQNFLINEIKIAMGPIGEVIQLISSVIHAALNVAESVETASGVVSNEMSTFQKVNQKLTGWFNKLKSYSKEMDGYQEQQYPVLEPETVQTGGATRKHLLSIQKGGKQTLIRTKKSIHRFLNGGIKSSQINRKSKRKRS